jgi:Fe-S-cluster formation regulator IscX/YfhJ
MKHNPWDFSAPIASEQRIKDLMEIINELDPETEEFTEIRSEIWKLENEAKAA